MCRVFLCPPAKHIKCIGLFSRVVLIFTVELQYIVFSFTEIGKVNKLSLVPEEQIEELNRLPQLQMMTYCNKKEGVFFLIIIIKSTIY